MPSLYELTATKRYLKNAWIVASRINSAEGRKLADDLYKLRQDLDKEIEKVQAKVNKRAEKFNPDRNREYDRLINGGDNETPQPKPQQPTAPNRRSQPGTKRIRSRDR